MGADLIADMQTQTHKPSFIPNIACYLLKKEEKRAILMATTADIVDRTSNAALPSLKWLHATLITCSLSDYGEILELS